METESVQANYRSTESPHFDEEWTLLSARPVVPLKEVKSARITRRTIKLTGLFAAALLLGAICALVVVSLERSRNIPSIQDETFASEPQNISDEPKPESQTTAETAEPTGSVITESPVAPKTVAVVREKPKVAERDRAQRPETSDTDKESVESDAESTVPSRAVLFDEMRANWEERRARRVRRQERRERAGRRGRDLRKIDEIFEGPRP